MRIYPTRLALTALRVAIALGAGLGLVQSVAHAQYCPAGSRYFSSNYIAQCSVGSCWSSVAFAGSSAITGSYPASNYACATVTPPTGSSENTLFNYDANGNRTGVTDALSHVTTSGYDRLNRLVTLQDAANGTTTYAYNGISDLTRVTDPRAVPTSYTVNGLGQTVSLSSPDTGVTSSTYDTAGNVSTRTDARGVVATYTYDGMNRVTQIVYAKTGTPNEIHTFEYDGGTSGAANAKGHLTKLTDPSGVTTWTYEAHGRVQSKSQTVGMLTQIVTYGYNAGGQLETITTPSGQSIQYSYSNNRVSGISVNGVPVISSAIAEPFGPLSTWHWGNSGTSFRDFDLDGRVTSWEADTAAATPVIRNNLDFDAGGRVTQLSDPANSTLQSAYQYDALDRLTVVQKGSPVASTLQYGYDAAGNRQTFQVDASASTSTYDAASNKLQSTVGAIDPLYMLGASSVDFTYNNANRLVQVQADNTTVATYLVNALGQRVQKSVLGAVTQFVYDEAGHLIGEYDGSGQLIQETVWMEDSPVATLRPAGSGTPTPVAIYYVHVDHLATPRAITRPSDNALMWRWDNSDPFGSNAPNENPTGQGTFKYNLRFPGQYYDAEIGTHYNYFRDYDPSLGRYVQSDPIGRLGGLNTYAYVNETPLVRTDRFGLRDAPADPWGEGRPLLHPDYRAPDAMQAKCWVICKLKMQLVCNFPLQSLGTLAGMGIGFFGGAAGGPPGAGAGATLGAELGNAGGFALCAYLTRKNCDQECPDKKPGACG